MRSAKKSTKVLSALSMAAVAVIGLKASSAHGATVTLYYGDDTYANSNNDVAISGTYRSGATKTDTQGAAEYLSQNNTNSTNVTTVAVSQTAATTINLPLNSYLSLAIDALVTGDTNPDGGNTTGPGAGATQPSFLGLAALGVGITSSDTTASILSPLAVPGGAQVSTASNGGSTYLSTGIVNGSQNVITHPTKQGSNSVVGSYNVVPNWANEAQPGDVEPNKLTGTGSDTGSTASGNIGINSPPFGGNTSVNSATTGGVNQLEQFAGTGTATYLSATDFIDSLVFKGLSAGTVTLTPSLDTAATAYWTLQTAGSTTFYTGPSSSHTHNGSASQYKTQGVSGADTLGNLPVLVINVIGASSTATHHAVIALSATANTANYGTTVLNGTGDHNGTFTPVANSLTSTGSNGGYTLAEVTGINGGGGDATDNVGVTGISATDAEIFGLDVKVSGTQASSAQLAVLINAIAGDGQATASVVTSVTTADPTHGDISSLDNATNGLSYNLFLTFAAGFNPGSLGFDLSNANDSNLSGYDITAVAVVPEPMSLGLLALGGVGLMSRRSRRKS